MARFVVTGGLTGGHVMPCVTIARALASRGHAVLYIGAAGELEARTCQRHAIDFVGISYPRGARRAARWSALGWGFPAVLSTIRRFAADAIFSKGSQVSVPVVAAAWTLRLPVVLHESDVVAGSENRLVARLSTVVCVGWPEAQRSFGRPVHVTGNIPGPGALEVHDRPAARSALGIQGEKPLILILGGSQGALTLNRLVYPIVPALCARHAVLHQCGPGKVEDLVEHPDYVQGEFIDDMGQAYSAADLVVGRAGATTILEVASHRLPALYVPYPWAEDDHQAVNAARAAALGVAEVADQASLTPERLLALVEAAPSRRTAPVDAPAFRDGTHGVVDLLERTASRSSDPWYIRRAAATKGAHER
jgi:UDP-N-acetylglucosamine--N-acetylmuramyl-(pentapeptide) pyrophosphoryl-undecaprenol N-acetylglucosamine transferase